MLPYGIKLPNWKLNRLEPEGILVTHQSLHRLILLISINKRSVAKV